MPTSTAAPTPAHTPSIPSAAEQQLPTHYSATDEAASNAARYTAWESSGAFAPESSGDPAGRRFAMILPPPNITGSLHMGHAYEHTISDAFTRYQRMTGAETLWLPGTDHAGIATQALMERQLATEGTSRHDLGREKFLARTRAWREQSGETITGQMRRLGASPDWDRATYTLDPGPALATHEAFTRLYSEGLIYRAARDTSWCTGCQTTLADIETEPATDGTRATCTRCGSPIEIRSTPQWFLATKGLAAKARTALTSGQLTIDPPELEAEYLRWLDGMHDWCLSRQLWWGHQLPIWYGPDGDAQSFAPGEDIPAGWTRDEDTLDTWFSSGLWPLSTLGWPTATADLARYYPNDLLITGYDLLFFWAIRMTMLCTHLAGTPPFRRLYLHGMIRDEHGKKMSKSFGNTVDPLEFINEYGPDSLRLALARRARPGADIPFGRSDMAGAQALLKKLWSTARMAQSYDIHIDDTHAAAPACRHPLDIWLAATIRQAAAAITDAFDRLDLAAATETLAAFIESDLSDTYLEARKPALRTDPAARAALAACLRDLLLLAHPIAPFLTERLWEALGGEPGPLDQQPWPGPGPGAAQRPLSPREAGAAQEISALRELLRATRSFRDSHAIAPAARIPARIDGLACAHELARLGRLQPESAAGPGEGPGDGSGSAGGWTLFRSGTASLALWTPAPEAADLERLRRELNRAEAQEASLRRRADDPAFRANAPASIQERTRAGLARAEEDIDRLRAQLLSS